MATHTCKVDNQGRITLPAEWRKAQGVKPGREVVITVGTDERLLIETSEQTLDQARAIVARHVRGPVEAVEQLLSDRRREALGEARDADRHAVR